MTDSKSITRREFIKNSTAAVTLGLTAASAPSIVSGRNLNEKINMGFIGVGNRGSQLLKRFRQNTDVRVAALCDVYAPYRHRNFQAIPKQMRQDLGHRIPKMAETFPNPVAKYTDFRRLLEDKEIDAVCIATPDHWHALQTILACQAGKDVYVEKPLTITIYEGRRMVEVAEQTRRVVGVGLNRRGSVVYQHLAQAVANGLIGKVTVGRAGRVSNMYPDGIGNYQPTAPPKALDWNLWLGPRASRPYQANIAPYKFRWWRDYSSQMGNWGVHFMDAIRWLIGEQAPKAISAVGGKYVLTDDRTIPDTMEVVFEFASGAVANFSIHEATSGRVVDGEIELRGTKGNLLAREMGYRLLPANAGQFQKWESAENEEIHERAAFLKDPQLPANATARLIRNFLDCIKSRETPLCPLEEGHRSTTFAHLANIALEMGTRIEWDPVQEKITNLPEANRLLHYDYREPWKL